MIDQDSEISQQRGINNDSEPNQTESREVSSMSRRDFFTRFTRPFGSLSRANLETSVESISPREPIILSRREFVQMISLAGAALATSSLPALNKADDKDLSGEQPNIAAKQESEDTYVDTMFDSGALLIAEIAMTEIFDKLNIPIGNAGLTNAQIEKLLQAPIEKILIQYAGLHSAFEEALFRGLPQTALNQLKVRGNIWKVGIPTSVLFALMHNIKREKLAKEYHFSTDFIPLPQFVGGLFYWKMMRERGFPHAIVAHGTQNGAIFTIGKFLYEMDKRDAKSKNNSR